ncbi:hypothetical protein D3C75_1015900 [compost metagenome]
MLDKSVRTHRTINEIRKEKDLPPLENGDIILDQTYTNYIMQKQQQQEMAQQAPEGQEAPDNPEEAQQQQQDQEISNSIDDQYGDNDNTQ